MDTCPKCHLQSVEHEDGGTYCRKCGYALSEGDVEPSIQLGPSGEQQGHYVSTSGKVAGSDFRGGRQQRMLQTGVDQEMPYRMHVQMKQLASQVHSSDSFTQDALDLLPQVYALISGKGCMPLEIMTAASLFLSVRQANLPYTLAEMARLVGKPLHVIASAYKTVVLALNSGIRPLTKTAKRADSDAQQHNHAQQPIMDTEGRCKAPPVDFAHFAMRHLSSLQGVKVSVTQKRLIAEQYVQLMEWIDRTQCMVRHPSLMAAALQLTAEAYKVKIAAAPLANAFCVSPRGVSKHATQIRQCLLAAAGQLAWLKCTLQNVMQHLRTILLVHAPQPAVKVIDTPMLADTTVTGSNSDLKPLAFNAEQVCMAATACSSQQASIAVNCKPSVSKKRQRQTSHAGKSAWGCCSAEQPLSCPTSLNKARCIKKPTCKRDQLPPEWTTDTAAPAVSDTDSHLDDSLIAAHEWSQYMRSPGEIAIYESVLQCVQ